MDCDNHKHLGVYVLSHMKQTGNLLNPIYKQPTGGTL